MLELFSTVLKNISRKFGRMTLTVCGIAIGVFSVIIIGGIGASGTSAVNSELDSLGLGGFTVSVTKGYEAELGEKEAEIINNTEYIKSSTPVLIQTVKAETDGEPCETFLWGIKHNADKAISLNILYGRFISQEDIANNSKVCLVDKTFANKIYSRDNIVGKKISVCSEKITDEYEVIGVLETGGELLQSTMGTVVPNFMYVPYTIIQEATGCSGFHQIITKVQENSSVDKLSKMITAKLDRNAGISGAYTAVNLAKQKDVLLSIMDIVSIVLTAVGGVSLVVSSLSIMTVMLVSVSERTKEIGIKKAVGASKRRIVVEFLTEAVFLSLIGCVIGLIIGISALFIGGEIMNIDVVYNIPIIIFSAIFSLISGIVFGVYPAYKAAALPPVKALRFE